MPVRSDLALCAPSKTLGETASRVCCQQCQYAQRERHKRIARDAYPSSYPTEFERCGTCWWWTSWCFSCQTFGSNIAATRSLPLMEMIPLEWLGDGWRRTDPGPSAEHSSLGCCASRLPDVWPHGFAKHAHAIPRLVCLHP